MGSRFIAPQAYQAFLEAELAAHRGDRVSARQWFGRALLEDPESPELRLRLAELASEEGEATEALRLAREARRVDPRYPRALLVEAKLLRRQAPLCAMGLLRRALSLDPRQEEVYLWLASLVRHVHGVAAEERVYRDLLRVNPESLDGLLGLARVQARSSRLDEASAVLSRAIHAHPFVTEPWLQLARIRIRQGQWDRAARCLYQGLEATGDDLLIAEELFRLWLMRGRPDRARNVVDLLKGHLSGSVQTFIGTLLERLGEPSLAEETLRGAFELDPSHGPAIVHLSRLRRRQGDDKGARQILAEIPPASPIWPEVQVELALQLESEGLVGEAERRLVAVLTTHRQEPLAHETLAFLLARSGRLKAARDSLEYARRARGESRDEHGYRYGLLLLLEVGGRWSKARALAEELLREDPDEPLIHNVLAYGLLERGVEGERARGHLRKALQLDPTNPYILDSQGWALVKEGRFSDGISFLEQAVRVDRRLWEGWAHLGEALRRSGRWKEAERAWLTALRSAPSVSARAVLKGRLMALEGAAKRVFDSGALRVRARSIR